MAAKCHSQWVKGVVLRSQVPSFKRLLLHRGRAQMNESLPHCTPECHSNSCRMWTKAKSWHSRCNPRALTLLHMRTARSTRSGAPRTGRRCIEGTRSLEAVVDLVGEATALCGPPWRRTTAS